MISPNAIVAIYSLMDSVETQQALAEFVEDAKATLTETLRANLRSSRFNEASQCEGGLVVLEDLLGLLATVAKMYQPNS